jgi:hypothetical protein
MVNREEFEKVSYLEVPPGDTRTVPLDSCYLGGDEWESWIPDGNGALIPIKIVKPIEGQYFAKEPVEEDDGHLLFLNVIVKHCYYPDVARFTKYLLDDIFNLSASVAKLDLMFEAWRADPNAVDRRFVGTELEYIFGTSRAMFDLLHKVVVGFLRRFRYVDEDRDPVQQLPRNSFAKVALDGDDLRTADQIAAKWNLPETFAAFYSEQAEFFRWVRDFRVAVTHHGKNASPIFMTERGFAVSTRDYPFDALEIWCDTNLHQPNSLGSVRSLVGYLISGTLVALETFAHVLTKVQLPPDVAPGYRVWVRGPNLNLLKEVQAWIEEKPWYDQLVEIAIQATERSP